jgi:membrane protease YdiL (CAAX protease family)
MSVAALPWDFALILLVLAVVVPWRGTRRVRELLARPVLGPSDRIAMYGSTISFQWATTGLTAWRVHERLGTAPFVIANLGLALPHPVRAITIGASLSLVIALSQILSLRAVSRLPAERRGKLFEVASKLMPHTLTEALPFLALVCTVSVCEEFLYRGFAFAVLGEILGHSVAAAILGSSAIFAIGHLYQGPRGVATTFVLGVILAGVRSWTGSLLPCMMAHFVTDLIAGFAGPRGRLDAAREGGAARKALLLYITVT